MLTDIHLLKESFMEALSEITYTQYSIKQNDILFERLNSFAAKGDITDYTALVGSSFLDHLKESGFSKQYLDGAELFVHRLNALLCGKSFPIRRASRIQPDIPKEFSRFLEEYRSERTRNGMKDSSIDLNVKIFRRYFENLEEAGCESFNHMNPELICRSLLPVQNTCYLEKLRTLFRYLFHHGYLNRDFSFLVPVPKRPQPIPDVYSIEEIQRMEAYAKTNLRTGKRDYAALLLATRYGIRGGDISRIMVNAFDFENDMISLCQQKTGTPLVLPLISDVKTAITDYLESERKDIPSPYLFLSVVPPYDHISVQRVDKIVRTAIRECRINSAGRGCGIHAFRSSVASSMVNDGIPYEAVRKMLGHSDQNAIKSYVRLDVEQLRPYALSVPEATGSFLDFLNGKRGVYR